MRAERLSYRGVATMQLSPKGIYKKPYVGGTCPYYPDSCSEDMEVVFNNTDNPGKSPVLEDEQSADEADVAMWIEETSEHEGQPCDGDAKAENADDSAKYEDKNMQAAQLVDERAIREKANRMVQEILAKKQDQCSKEGYAQGKAKAEDQCRTMQESASTKLREAELSLREARQRAAEIIAASERKIVELALAVSEKLVCKQLEVDPKTVNAVVREAMNMLNGGEQVEMYVHPGDVETCFDYRDSLKEEFKEIIKLDIFGDEKIPRGSCRIESESGVAEYLIDDEKEQLKETLIGLARQEEKQQLQEEDSAYEKH